MDGSFAGMALAGQAMDGLFNVMSTDMTNSANKRIARENREWQSEENQKQRDWEYQRWLEEQQYNTPSAIMKRYEEAGINPFIGQSKIGEGTTVAPSAPGFQSAPNAPTMVAPKFAFGSALGQFADYMLQKQAVDANSANQQAQSIRAIGEAARDLYDAFGAEKAEQMIAPLFAQVRGANMDSSIMARRSMSYLRRQEAEADLSRVNANLVQKFGEEKAWREISNMDYQLTHMVAEVGLWSSLAKLNESNVSLNSKREQEIDQQIVESLSRTYKNFCESELVQSLKLTEDQKRTFYIGTMALQFLSRYYDVDEQQADWAFDTDVRSKKRDSSYQGVQGYRFGLDNGYGSVTYDKFTKMLNQAVGGGLKPPRAGMRRDPTQYVRHRATRPTYSGKEEIEWYTPYAP